MGDINSHDKWQEQAKEWKSLDDLRLLLEAVGILLEVQLPSGDTINTDTNHQRKARLLHIELRKRMERGKSTEQRYKESLNLIAVNADKVLPNYNGDEKALLKIMNDTKNPLLKKMYAIRQYARATLKGTEVPPTPSKPTPPPVTSPPPLSIA